MKNNKWKKYTEEEEELLRKLYPTESTETLEQTFGRKIGNIRYSAMIRGLTRLKEPMLKGTDPPNLTEYQLGYICGFIDADGCVSIHSKADGYFHPKVTIDNTRNKPLKKIIEWLGFGTINHLKRKGNDRDLYRLDYNKKSEVYILLKTIKSKLILKQEQAELLLQWFDIWRTYPYHKPVTDPILIEIKKEIHLLNRKGKTIKEIS